VYSAYNGLINHLYLVGCKKQDSFIVFKLTQEYTNKGIIIDIIGSTLFHKHVRLIKEQSGFPVSYYLKDIRKPLLKYIRSCA